METLTDHDVRLAAYFDGCAADGVMTGFEPDEDGRLDGCLRRWGLRPGERVLEPGCGSGRLTERLAREVGPSGRVVGFDLSPGMLRHASQRDLPEWADLLRATASAVPFPDGCFDRVICFSAVPHFQPLAPALAELARVTRPGGALWIAHLASREAINALHRELEGPVRHHQLPPPEELSRILALLGLETRHVEDGDCFQLEAVRI